MNPIADLRRAVLDLDHVPDSAPVEPGFVYGAPSMLAYDAASGVVRLNVGGGQPTGRPTMGQLRAWLGLPARTGLAGAWASMRGREPFTPRGILTFVSAAASGFHGVRRNGGSVLWGLIWFGLGAALPGVVPAIAIAQGYGECANNCRPGPTYRS